MTTVTTEGLAVAGQTYSLICTVSVTVSGLMNMPSIRTYSQPVSGTFTVNDGSIRQYNVSDLQVLGRNICTIFNDWNVHYYILIRRDTLQ